MTTPTYHFRVCSSGETNTVRKGDLVCRIGEDVRIDPDALEDFCFQLLSERQYELALLAGVIAYADRRVRRQHSAGWSRRITVTMPVRHPAHWQLSSPILRELLQFLTGDYWNINFICRRTLWGKARQDVFPLGSGRFVVVPYSNGLDSFAQSQILKAQSPQLTPIRITAWNRGLAGDREWRIDADGTRYRRVSIPIQISTTNHPEPTYRTRSFLFNVFAGIAAHLSDAEAVIIPENGQGSLGPSMVAFGGESPQRGSHPAFTRKLGHFLEIVLGKPVVFDHPQMWRTKGEVMKILKDEKLLNGWLETVSCPRDRRDVNLNGKSVHCGVCAGCLLRRMAAFVSELSEPDDKYLWCNLRSTTLPSAIHADSKRKTRPNDADIANHGVLAMTELAKLADVPDDNPSLSQTSFDIAGPKGMQQALSNLKRLLAAHKKEWTEFRNQFGPEAWINSNFAFL